MMTGWIRELVTDLMGPDRPVAVFRPASPADGTQIRKRASGGNPLQITCTVMRSRANFGKNWMFIRVSATAPRAVMPVVAFRVSPAGSFTLLVMLQM